LPEESLPIEGEAELNGETISIHLAKKQVWNNSDIVGVLVNEGYLEKTPALLASKGSRRIHPVVKVHGRSISETILEDRR